MADEGTAAEKAQARRERDRASRRRYAERNPEKVKAQRARYNETHREENNARERERKARARQAARDAEERRRRSREKYADDPVAYLDYQRTWRATQRAESPDAYREAKRVRQQRWYEAHKEEQLAKRREKYRLDPERKRAASRENYAAHPDDRRARAREYYMKNREAQQAKHRQWMLREARRRDVGLPVRRVHVSSVEERRAHATEAGAFFRRTRTAEEIQVLLQTPDVIISAWRRDCDRARAAHAASERDLLRPLSMTAVRQLEIDRRAAAQRAEAAAEDARLDAIARAINDQLRTASALPAPRPSTENRLPAGHMPTKEMGR